MIPKPCKPKLLTWLVIAVLVVLPTDVLTSSADEENHNEDVHDDKAKFYAGRSKRGYKYKPLYEARTTTDWLYFIDKPQPTIKPRYKYNSWYDARTTKDKPWNEARSTKDWLNSLDKLMPTIKPFKLIITYEKYPTNLSGTTIGIIVGGVIVGLIIVVISVDYYRTKFAIRRKRFREALVRHMERNEHTSEQFTSAASNSDNRDRENNANSYTIPIVFTEDLQVNSKQPQRFMGNSTPGPAALHQPMGCPVDPSLYRTVYGAP